VINLQKFEPIFATAFAFTAVRLNQFQFELSMVFFLNLSVLVPVPSLVAFSFISFNAFFARVAAPHPISRAFDVEL
jgi:hypothetical protein